VYNVYLLKLKGNSIYTGTTPNLKRRIKEHKKGYVDSTKDKSPIHLEWYCKFNEKVRALEFEKYLKTGSGQAFRNKRLV